MTLFFALIGIAVITGIVLLATGRLGGELPEPLAEPPLHAIAPGDLTPADIDGVRLDQALRGYRMDQVDALVDRLSAEITTLRASGSGPRVAATPAPDADDSGHPGTRSGDPDG